MIVELNRRLVKGYTHYKDDPRIINLKKGVVAYNKKLWALGVRDHQVEYAKFSVIRVVFTLIYRFGKLAILALGTIPGLFLFAPVFMASKLISIKKSREALAASTVKLQGRDVMATWKLLVSMAIAPSLYFLYSALLTYWTWRNRAQGYIPLWVPLWFIPIPSIIFFISITFAALRFGEIGMDIFKSLRPLVLSLNPTSANTLVRLREERKALSQDVTDLINTLGPDMFPDFDSTRIVANPFRDSGYFNDPGTPKTPTHARTPSHPNPPTTPPAYRQMNIASIAGGSAQSGHLPRNESLHNLATVGLFASRPPSRSRSRSNSTARLGGNDGLAMHSFPAVDSKEGMDEVSQKIRGAMRERRRKSQEQQRGRSGGGWDFTTPGSGGSASGSLTPDSVEEKKRA